MLFLEDSYIKEFDSIVTEIIDDKIFLESTAFYAKSGGQPGDQGVFHSGSTNYQVSDTIKYEGKIAHIIHYYHSLYLISILVLNSIVPMKVFFLL